jgi:predicted glutamine amidotransferase
MPTLFMLGSSSHLHVSPTNRGNPIMCRWIAYLGTPVFVEDFVCVPCQSLIAQSRNAREAHSEMNADGFGLGWYGERPIPGVFRDIRPAWSDENLMSLAHQIKSGLYFAHVRASTGTSTTRANCHPFTQGRMLFMHNGQIGGYERVRRTIDAGISDALYNDRTGTTDSEALFLTMVGDGLATTPQATFERAASMVAAAQAKAGVTEAFRCTAAWSDGHTLSAVRYSSDDKPPSLYTRQLPDGSGTLVVSEPLDTARDGWQAVPPQSFVTVTRAGVTVVPLRVTVGAAG